MMKIEEKVIQDKVLEHQLEEWRTLNAYLNKIDTEYRQLFVMVISIFTVLATLLSEGVVTKASLGIVIIPLGIIAILVFWSYQSRITAILRGHLSALEQKMNDTIGKNVHMWNSALTEAFMARNNLINRYMIIPMSIIMVVLLIFCFDISKQAFEIIPHNEIWLSAYWIAVGVCLVMVMISLCTNERVRRETFYEERVWQKYQEYMQEEKQRNPRFNYVKVKPDKKIEDKRSCHERVEMCDDGLPVN